MEFDLGTAEQSSDYISVPAGTYVCEITELREGQTRNGDPRWAMKLVVAEGEYAGRLAAWDSLVLSTRGVSRARRVLAALGLPCRGKVDLNTTDLEGRRALVDIRPAEYVTPSGESIRRNEVPYDGYRALPEGQDPEQDGAATIPF